MDDRELEKRLAESADKVEIRGFSSRWKEIKAEISPPERNRKRALKYFTALATGCCLIALAVILPFALRPNNEFVNKNEEYLFPEDVTLEVTTKEQFFRELNSANFETVDLSSLRAEEYLIAKSAAWVPIGGQIVYNNSDGLLGYIFTVTFYSSDFAFEEGNLSDLTNTVTIEDTKVAFETDEGDLYESRAFFVLRDISYVVEFSSRNNDFLEFLTALID